MAGADTSTAKRPVAWIVCCCCALLLAALALAQSPAANAPAPVLVVRVDGAIAAMCDAYRM